MSKHVTRRTFLRFAGASTAGALLAACGPTPTPQVVEKVVKETVVVAGTPQVVEKVVTKEVEKVVTKEVEKVAEVKLLFWTYSFPIIENLIDLWIKALQEVHPEIKVETQITGWDEYWVKLETGMAAGVMPDIFMHDWGLIPRMAYHGITLALDPFLEKDHIDLNTYWKGAIDSGRWDPKDILTGKGPLWGWANLAQVSLIYYNKNMFDAAGLPYPKPDWTWDDFVANAKALTKDSNGDGKIDQWGTWVDPGMQISRPWTIWGAGGDFLNADHTKATFNSPETVEGVRWLVELVTKHKVAPVPGPQQVDVFESGQVAMHPAGMWMIPEYNNIKNFKWDVTMIPKHPKTGLQAGPIDTGLWSITSISKNQDASWEFLKVLCGPPGMKIFADVYASTVALKEANSYWFNSSAVPPGGKELAKALDLARYNPVWLGRSEWETVSLTPEIDQALRGDKTVEEACEAINVEMQKSLDEAWNLSKV